MPVPLNFWRRTVRSEVRFDSRLFRSLSRSLLREGLSIRFRAHGRSMFPAIADGEDLHVEPSLVAHAGDVVLADGEFGLRAHRVLSQTSGGIVTRGDSCIEDDAPGSRDSVLGSVSHVIAKGKRRRPHTLRSRILQIFSWLHLR